MNLPYHSANGHHEPYTGHQGTPTHVTEEEKMLLEQLKNTSLSSQQQEQKPSDNTRNHIAAKFAVPVVPSPISARRYDDEVADDNVSVENVHLSVGDSKKHIKLSSDSGLGSSELGEDHQQWKNGKSVFFYRYYWTMIHFFFSKIVLIEYILKIQPFQTNDIATEQHVW